MDFCAAAPGEKPCRGRGKVLPLLAGSAASFRKKRQGFLGKAQRFCYLCAERNRSIPLRHDTYPFPLFLLSCLFCVFAAAGCSGDEPQPSSPGGGGGETAAGAVDLGLSVRWASCNLGATAPHEAGGLYGWADPTGQAVTDQVHDEAHNWTSPLYGGTDPMPDICRTVYDLPHVRLGGCWRLPSEAEARELVERCTWREGTRQGVKGYTVTGPNGRSIFLPMAGMRLGEKHYMQGDRGYYWTGTRHPGTTGAVSLWVGVGHSGAIGNDYRFQGCSIRPVLGTDSTTFTYDSPLDTVDRRVDMGVLSDSGKPLYWASGDLVVRRFARAYIAHEPTFVPEHPIFEDGALEWNLFSWGDATGRIKYYSPEWYDLDISSLPDEISGDARYDIARAQLGEGWRLPTESEWKRLFENCTIDCDRRLRYYRTWLTSKTTGNTICFYMSGVIDFISPEHGSYSEGVGEYLSGTKNRTANFFFNMVGEDIAHSDTIMYSSINWSSIGMFFVRPVTE